MSQAQERRKEIINLELIQRDNTIYTDFEKDIEDGINIDYLFCMQCYIRYSFTNGGSCKISYPLSISKKLETLKKIDENIYNYYSSLVNHCMTSWKASKKGYSVKTNFDQYALIQALGEKRFKELSFYGKSSVKSFTETLFVDGYPVNDLQKHLEYGLMTSQDIIKIQNYIKNKNHGWHTTIKRNYAVLDRTPFYDKNLKTNNILIDIDLNKSENEIIDFIKKIKNDYDLDKKNNKEGYKFKNIPKIYDLLGMKEDDIFTCDIRDCIVNSDNNKNMFEKYADILFIYDCKIAGYTNKEIYEEFTKYYHHGIKQESIKKYYNIAREYIDNQKYLSFLTGYST